MTEQEAEVFINNAKEQSLEVIEKLRKIKDNAEKSKRVGEYYCHLENCEKEIEACDVAISALEEIQQYRELNKERGNVLKRLLNGEWVDTKDVEKYLNIDFSDGMKLFELSRTAEWNPPPLDGQKITTKFRLRNKEFEEYQALGTVEELKSKIEELKRWHSDHIVKGIKNEFANTSTLICHNCDHKDEYIMELEAEVEELREAREKQNEIEKIINMQLIAGKNNYKEIYDCFYEIVKVFQRH